MECVAVFLLIVVIGTVAAGALGSRAANRRRRRRLFQQLACQFHGVYEPGGMFATPRVRLRYGDTAAMIHEAPPLGPLSGSALQVSVAWPHTELRCEIVAGAGRRLLKDLRFSWPFLPLDHDEFSVHYLITGFPENDVTQLLTSGVRWNLDRLRCLGADHRLYVLIRDGQILVQKHWKRLSADQASQFIQGVLELFDQCMLAKASGIEFLHGDVAQPLDDVTCKVCGDSITDDLVYCRRCKTPHHQECWHYAGVCSVFGCRKTLYVLPESGRSPRFRINKPR